MISRHAGLARARRERRASRRLPTNPYLQITSMTDMFTLILAFLLSFYDPNQVDAPSLVLPSVPVMGETKEGVRLEVRRDGVVLDGVVLLTLDDAGVPVGTERAGRVVLVIRDALQGRSESGGLLLVSCDKSVAFGVLGDVLASASAAGFNDYRFVVESTR